MIKVSVFYPSGEGKTFDMDYYCNKHIPFVQQLIGDTCKKAEVEQGFRAWLPDINRYIWPLGICFLIVSATLRLRLLTMVKLLWPTYPILPTVNRCYKLTRLKCVRQLIGLK